MLHLKLQVPYTAFGMASAHTTATWSSKHLTTFRGPVLCRAITVGGILASAETTVLITAEETLEALAKGKTIGYRRPGE